MYFIEPLPGLASTARLGLMPHPAGGEYLLAAMRKLRTAGVDILVSLIELDETVRLNLEAEGATFQRLGGKFISHPVTDRSIPQDSVAFKSLALELAAALTTGRGQGVMLHCWGGIGRSGMLACAVQCAMGSSLAAARAATTSARGVPVPETHAQLRWLEDHYGT